MEKIGGFVDSVYPSVTPTLLTMLPNRHHSHSLHLCYLTLHPSFTTLISYISSPLLHLPSLHSPPGYLAVPHDDQLMEAVAALDLFRCSLELRTPFRVRRAPNSPWEEAGLRNLATGYTALGIHLESLFLNKGLVLPQADEEKNKGREDNDNLTEPLNPSEERLGRQPYERSLSYLSYISQPREEAPYTSSETSKQQELGMGAEVQVRVRAGRRGVATASLLKPQSGRRARVQGRGKTTAPAMNDEGRGDGVRYYSSCQVSPCHVIDPLLHPLLLPQHLQAAARIAQREAAVPRSRANSEFTAPDHFKDAELFIDFYKYQQVSFRH